MWKAFRFFLVPAAGVRLAAHLTSWIAGHAFDLTARPRGLWLFVAADILLVLTFAWLALVVGGAAVLVRWWKKSSAERRRLIEKAGLLRKWTVKYRDRLRAAGSGWAHPVSPERRLPQGT
jgi:hypothetical protein